MRSFSNRPTLLGAIAAGLLAAAPAHKAFAQIPVTDVAGNAQWVQQTMTQIKSLAQQAQSYAAQLQQYQTQLQQYANMVTNTVALPQEVWSTVQSDIMRVQALSNAASLLSGNSGSLITRLQGASAYVNQAGSLANIPSQITGYQQAIGNNLSAMGKVLGIQQGMETSNAALLATLQQHSQSATGQMQAIQAGNELAHAQATQLMQIQATLSATAQMQATEMAVNADRRAMSDSEIQHFNSAPQVTTGGYQQW
jgi:P-type conjugative transfer protein TrbJ